MKRILLMATMIMIGLYAGSVMADVPGRAAPSGIVPNPGTQQQELTNITAPGTYNVFEFPNFCAGCHGGTLDQNTSHYGNWAGSNMANSGRDPFFRTNNLIVNADAYYGTGGAINGVGNICWRCHSPNGWYSSRLDESQGGKIDGTTIEQSLVKSTDMQGISCEFCHRTVGNVTFKRADLVANPAIGNNDPAWLLLAGATDWPHTGNPYPEGPLAGNPYGDTTFQFNDGKVYQADLPGNQLLFWSDIPTSGGYTGQTYGIYPPGFAGANLVAQTPFGQPVTNLLGETIAYLPNGQSKLHFEQSVSPPKILDPATGQLVADYEESSISPRHATHMGGIGAGGVPVVQDGLTASGNRYLPTAEMCGTCHDLTVPTLNSGMPEQRTYTEWKYSRFGRTNFICQDCHMGEAQHESKDGMAGTFKADPEKAGYFPYAKPRPASAIHKFSPANRDLGSMLAWLNPEVDLEVTGKPSGEDTRTSNGVLSSRTETYARQTRNGELKLRDAARLEIVQQPTLVSGTTYEVKVKVTNLTGHSFPSGYPDGRRAFVTLNVSDATNALVYQSGFYDNATADLKTTAVDPFKRAQSPVIDAAAGNNAVMVYEKKTGSPNINPATNLPDGTYKMGESLLNPVIVFDNRLHPAGWTAEFENAGVRLVNYTGTEAAAIPFNEPTRFGALTNPRLDGLGGPNDAGAHWDVITYRFTSATPPTNARAEIFYQSHARDFVEYLKDRNNQESLKDLTGDPAFPLRPATLGGPKPEGTPSINEVNYPFTPNYLGDNINVTSITDLNGQPLMNNWGGVMYASWLATGKGAPFSIDAADTTQVAAPAAPAVTAVSLTPFKNQISWGAVAGAEKYVVLVRFGTAGTNDMWGVGLPNASWDRLAIVDKAQTSFDHVVKPGKTYGYMVYAVNDATFSDPLNDQVLEFNFGLGGGDAITGALETVAFSAIAEVTTPGATPTEPKNLQVAAVTSSSVKLTWYDQAIDESGFIVERQLVNPNGSRGAFVALPVIASQTTGATGIGYNTWIDTTVAAGTTYNYRVKAVNGTVSSIFSDIKSATTAATQPVIVPNVVGQTQANAQAAVTAATLANGTVTLAYSSTVASGLVISQTPVSGTSVLPGTSVNLVVSNGPSPVAVPNVVGQTQTAAQAAVTAATLANGTVTLAYSSTVASGLVISQTPVSGTSVLPGTSVDLVVSNGPAPVAVPNVVGQTQAAAQAAVTAATLANGTVTLAYSSTVASGLVISQSPAAATSALPGTAVDLVVSNGPAPVTVPNVVGQTQANAQTAITAATLTIGTVTQAISATVPSGSVISQNPAAGTSVLPGSAVGLIVSTGPAPVVVIAAPLNLKATFTNTTRIRLAWQDASTNENNFAVWRSTNGAAAVQIGTVTRSAAQSTQTGVNVAYNDTTVIVGNTYDYYVIAVRTAAVAGTSTASNTASVLFKVPAAPSALTALGAIVNAQNARAILNWIDNATNETGLTVQMARNATFTRSLVTTNRAANVTTFQTGNLSRGTQYWFRVRANNLLGSSAWVNATPFPLMTP